MPGHFKKRVKAPKPKGVSNRNKGLQWLRRHATTGVFYFADDDNSYDIELFHEVNLFVRDINAHKICVQYLLIKKTIEVSVYTHGRSRYT